MPDGTRRGGEGDIRRRALLAVAALEERVASETDQLKRVRRVGAWLRLHYHARDDRFEWECRTGEGENWKNVATKELAATCRRLGLRKPTLARIDRIGGLLNRRATRGKALRVLERWLPRARFTGVVRVVWGMPGIFRSVWTWGEDGRLTASPTAQNAMGNRPARLPAVPEGQGGPLLAAVRELLRELERTDRELRRLRRTRSGRYRLYYDDGTDSWSVKDVGGAHVGQCELAALQGSSDDRVALFGANVIEQFDVRRGVRRTLGVVTTIAEIALEDHEVGTWTIRARDAKAWVTRKRRRRRR